MKIAFHIRFAGANRLPDACRMAFVMISLFSFSSASAQRTSSDCREDLQGVCFRLPIESYLGSDSITRIDFTVKFQASVPPDAPVNEVRKQLYLSKGQVRMISPDLEIYTDRSQSFWFYPYRSVIYRTKAGNDKIEFVKMLHTDLFRNGVVTQCELDFLNDSTASKSATFIADDSSMIRFGVSQVECTYSPFDSTFTRLRIEYTPGNEWKWAEYVVHDLNTRYRPEEPFGSLDEYFFDGEKPAQRWQGVLYYDRR